MQTPPIYRTRRFQCLVGGRERPIHESGKLISSEFQCLVGGRERLGADLHEAEVKTFQCLVGGRERLDDVEAEA